MKVKLRCIHEHWLVLSASYAFNKFLGKGQHVCASGYIMHNESDLMSKCR